jgi:PAS domain S-box-containing protein
MPSTYDTKNSILAKISVAARTLLSPPRSLELARYIGSGPSIRARARLALAAVFFVAVPTLLVGVLRTEKVGDHASLLSEYDNYWRQILETKITIKNLDLALWEYVVEREFENGQAALNASEEVKQAIATIVLQKPDGINIGPKEFLPGLVARLDGSIKRSIANYSSMASVRLSIIALLKEVRYIEKQVVIFANSERQQTIGALSRVSRDQLVLFLILLFAIPIFVGFMPGWLVSPLTRLRQLANKIEAGQLKDIVIVGRDEVGMLAKSLKSLFARKEEIDNKKSSKIFELRNVLRSTLKRVDEPIFIVDDSLKINYTNEAAASLVGIPQHQMEGTFLSDCMYCPVAKKAVEKAFLGDVSEEAIPILVEVSDGRSFAMQARIGVVRNRDGEVSRAVVVLHQAQDVRKD